MTNILNTSGKEIADLKSDITRYLSEQNLTPEQRAATERLIKSSGDLAGSQKLLKTGVSKLPEYT